MNDNLDFMASAKMTTKGQITIPKMVREKLKIDEGDYLVFYLDEKNNIKISNKDNCKLFLDDENKQTMIKRGRK